MQEVAQLSQFDEELYKVGLAFNKAPNDFCLGHKSALKAHKCLVLAEYESVPVCLHHVCPIR